MSGSLRERRPGVWELRVYVGRDPATGKKVVRSKTFHGGKRDANRALDQFAVSAPPPAADENLTLSEMIGRWIDH